MSDKPLISFDYAIKYLLKDKRYYEIVEGFISALLGTLGYKPVKINALLETESNREAVDLKRSIADLVVEDQEGNKYIVEIERSFTTNFMHKACYNTSRLVVDNISGNQDYRNIAKIFHISLLYFGVQGMTKPIYHGKTIVHEIDTHPVNVRIANQGLVFFENTNIFPEYLFISVPRFDDVVRQEVDEWLYILKHSDTKESFKSPYMTKLKERLNVLKMSNTERTEYFKYQKESIHSEDVLSAAEAKGEARGEAKGEARGETKGTMKVAKNLLAMGLNIESIMQATGLSKEEIQTLRP